MPLFLLALLIAVMVVPGTRLRGGEPLIVEVRETAGIQRFAYPVSVEFHAPADAGGFRLRDGARTIDAQADLLERAEPGQPALWSVDFTIDLLPNEMRRLTLGEPGTTADPPPVRRGLEVARADGRIRVVHPTLEFSLAEDLRGLLDSIRVSGDDFLVPGSPGLVIYSRQGSKLAIGGTPSAERLSLRVIKSGPLAVALEFSGNQLLSGNQRAPFKVRLNFPLGKSWVRADWTLVDSADAVAAMGAELQLRLDGKARPPILADVGAGGWTYAALRPEESLVFRAGPSKPEANDSSPAMWRVDRVLAGRATAFARPPSGGADLPPQGWAHLMDAQRATAIAVDRFARQTEDTIELAASGRVNLRREFSPVRPGASKDDKRLTFWLHVVSSPPQRGAATSPQAMLVPPEVSVVEQGRAP